jgi:hypothetical protein
VVSLTPKFRLHFFNSAGSTATLVGDGVDYQEKYADKAKRVGYYDLAAMASAKDTTGSDMSRIVDTTIRYPVAAAAADRNLLVILETLSVFTAASEQQFNLTLVVDNN